MQLRALEPQDDRDWAYAADAVRAALDGEGELREVAIDEDGLRCSVQQPGEPVP